MAKGPAAVVNGFSGTNSNRTKSLWQTSIAYQQYAVNVATIDTGVIMSTLYMG